MSIAREQHIQRLARGVLMPKMLVEPFGFANTITIDGDKLIALHDAGGTCRTVPMSVADDERPVFDGNGYPKPRPTGRAGMAIDEHLADRGHQAVNRDKQIAGCGGLKIVRHLREAKRTDSHQPGVAIDQCGAADMLPHGCRANRALKVVFAGTGKRLCGYELNGRGVFAAAMIDRNQSLPGVEPLRSTGIERQGVGRKLGPQQRKTRRHIVRDHLRRRVCARLKSQLHLAGVQHQIAYCHQQPVTADDNCCALTAGAKTHRATGRVRHRGAKRRNTRQESVDIRLCSARWQADKQQDY